MSKTAVVKELEALGKPTHAATYARHGITGRVLGVPYADLYKLQKRIGVDSKLAEQLWSTGVHDARTLAIFISDPATIKAATLDTWAKTVDNQLTLDAVAGLAAKTPAATARMKKWMAAKNEWVAATGWHVLSALCGAPEHGGLKDSDLASFVATIEKSIHGERNRTKHSMNGALIALGTCGPALEKKALAAAKRIGKVDIDHGDTSCKTPDALTYIKKVVAHQKQKQAKAAAKKKATKKTKKVRAH